MLRLNGGTDPHRAFGHEGAEYSIATDIRNASEFAWWVRFDLRKRQETEDTSAHSRFGLGVPKSMVRFS